MRGENSIFWPNSQTNPIRRLALAYVLAPLVLGSLVTMVAFLVAGMSEATTEGVFSVTLDAAMTLIPALLVFMLTFGAAGVVALWYLGQRGILAWTVTGALLGTVASLLLGELLMNRVERPLLIAAAIGGWALFLLFRWFAGIRET